MTSIPWYFKYCRLPWASFFFKDELRLVASDFLSFSHSATHSHSLTLTTTIVSGVQQTLGGLVFRRLCYQAPPRWVEQPAAPSPLPPRRLYQLPPHSRGGVWGGIGMWGVVAPTTQHVHTSKTSDSTVWWSTWLVQRRSHSHLKTCPFYYYFFHI